MQTFNELADLADKELALRNSELDAREARLDEKASLLASKEADLEAKSLRLDALQRQQSQDNEEISKKISKIRTDEAVRLEHQNAQAALETAKKIEKKAKELNDDTQQKLAELTKRELALSEREKTYKSDIELDVMRRFAFGK